jgi:phage terminase Nu1 subunit (DNA packaging protein)
MPGWLLVTQLELASLFGADRNTIATWTRAGMPVAHRGRGSRGHSYDVGACLRWIRERDRAEHEKALAAARAVSPSDSARARKLAAEAGLAELELRKRRGEIADVAEVEQRWTALVVAARNALLGVPTRAKQVIPTLTTKDVLELDALVRRVLDELADGQSEPHEGG